MNIKGEAIPKFNRKNLPYFRNEKNGFLSIISANDPYAMVQLLNSTAVEIVELCNGKYSINEIISLIQQKYYDTNPVLIKQCVEILLVRLDRSNLINWVKNDPFFQENLRSGYQLVKNITLKRNSENDFRSIFGFIHLGLINDNNIPITLIYMSPYSSEDQYNQLILRNKLFNFKEDFYTIYLRKQPLFLMGVFNNQPLKSTGTISIAIKHKDVSLLDMMDIIFPYLNKKMSEKITKLNCYIKYNLDMPVEIQNLWIKGLENNGFKKEAKLKNEYGKKIDEIIYTRKY